MSDIFERLSPGKSVNEAVLSELLLDPVTVDYLDSLNCFTLPVSVHELGGLVEYDHLCVTPVPTPALTQFCTFKERVITCVCNAEV